MEANNQDWTSKLLSWLIIVFLPFLLEFLGLLVLAPVLKPLNIYARLGVITIAAFIPSIWLIIKIAKDKKQRLWFLLGYLAAIIFIYRYVLMAFLVITSGI